MGKVADWIWKRPVFCRVSREHVPHPADLFRHDVECLRCGRHYDDGVAQVHRQLLIASRARAPRTSGIPVGAPAFRRRRAISS